jgi:hypothetical protein
VFGYLGILGLLTHRGSKHVRGAMCYSSVLVAYGGSMRLPRLDRGEGMRSRLHHGEILAVVSSQCRI